MATAKLRDHAPVLAVTRDTMKPMLGFFVDQLGFDAHTVLGEGPQFAMLRRDGKEVFLTCTASFTPPQNEWAIYFWVDDIEAMRADVVARGGAAGPLTDKPYEMVEFEISAPDGRVITFGQ
ncbi:MAG: hypothetical protein WAU68_10475 [Vitreimonas sp.]